jgi:hypothetical protein
MYTTQIGKSVRSQDSREEAYRAAYCATQEGWRYISIMKDDELECRVILKEDGGIFIWVADAPYLGTVVDEATGKERVLLDLTKKWECARFFSSVNGMNDVVFRN